MRAESGSVDVVVNADDYIDADATATWAVGRLAEVLAAAGLRVGPQQESSGTALRIVAALPGSRVAEQLSAHGAPIPSAAESFVIHRWNDGQDVLTVGGADGRGLAYGLLELADIVALSEEPMAALREASDSEQSPATPIRSISRGFVSDVEDKPWFYDHDFWQEYLTELATHRINRLQLALGMQYNYSHDPDSIDNYFCFAYPFLIDVPGYDVRAGGVSDEERDQNLATLKYISDEAKLRGIHFQLGLWNHAYEMMDSPEIRYPISGVTQENHAQYSAAALELLLRSCPSIDGLTLRVHYEGGVPEPGHEFWRTVMSAVTAIDRPVELDMHAKGVDEGLVDVARQTGSPVVISAKYWAEHQGLPYHQASVREKEKATPGPGSGLRSITAHLRRFTRYGFGDFLREDRDFDLIFRIWPGTQRLLLWGDPVLAAGYGRLGTIGGALGVELCEPLFFKGRKNSGKPGERDPYADPALQLGLDDWKKYSYTYRLWGRLLYDPDADPSSWRRFLRHEFGDAAAAVEGALGAASRVLPLVTVIHGLGASNNGYWPEMYVNMPIAGGAHSDHYTFDTAEPTTFGGVSSFDPTLFDRINDHADDLLAGRCSGRYTPVETAQWLERLADEAADSLEEADAKITDENDPRYRRLAVDVKVQLNLARFFAAKNRAGLSYALYERTREPGHLVAAVAVYQVARDAFARIVDTTTGVYRSDVTFGNRLSEHGHWADRLPGVDSDLDALKAEAEQAGAGAGTAAIYPPQPPRSSRPGVNHRPPNSFSRGAEVPLEVSLETPLEGGVSLHYRHLNQGEDWVVTEMVGDGERQAASIPACYTDSAYPLTYFFTVHHRTGDAWLVPGLDRTLSNQPYHVVRQRATDA
ncbi:hypothetical protein GCM10009841_03760 [Microlunatus panaciterrae]